MAAKDRISRRTPRDKIDHFINEIVVITGGTSGIGLAAARQFIKEGARLLSPGIIRKSSPRPKKELEAEGFAMVADVTKSAALDSLF